MNTLQQGFALKGQPVAKNVVAKRLGKKSKHTGKRTQKLMSLGVL
jgi:hypothetical protein